MPRRAPSSAALTIGSAPALAMGMVYIGTADSTVLVMLNAAHTQQSMQLTANAAIAAVVAKILRQGASS
jgi:hypothetical protein